MELEPGTVVGERYTIQSLLGEGGMARVYAATHNELGTQHAIKVLTSNSRTVRDRMLQEGRFQAKLRHPNIVAVTDVVAIGDSPGLVMEQIDGPPLDELVDRQRLSLDQVDQIARGLMAGVHHAHRLGLIHRDLKPANVLVRIEGQHPVPMVTDFGLAKLLAGDQGRAATRTGTTMGTPQYMSPEQIKDAKNVDEKSDVFALAAILYELLTGHRAFDGDHLLDIFQAIDAGTYTPIDALRPDAPPSMTRAIEAGLTTDRAARTPSVAALYTDWTDGETIPEGSVSHAPSSLPTFAPADPVPPARTAWWLWALGGSTVAAVAGLGGIVLTALVAWALWPSPTPTPPSPTATTPSQIEPTAPTAGAVVPTDPNATDVPTDPNATDVPTDPNATDVPSDPPTDAPTDAPTDEPLDPDPQPPTGAEVPVPPAAPTTPPLTEDEELDLTLVRTARDVPSTRASTLVTLVELLKSSDRQLPEGFESFIPTASKKTATEMLALCAQRGTDPVALLPVLESRQARSVIQHAAEVIALIAVREGRTTEVRLAIGDRRDHIPENVRTELLQSL